MTKDKEMLWKISEKLIAAREKAGITQAQLAERVGVESNSIHRYEAAEREMGFTIAIKIAKALNIGVRELIPDEYIEHSVSEKTENQLLDMFYQLDEQDQRAMMRQMMGLLLMKKQSA